MMGDGKLNPTDDGASHVETRPREHEMVLWELGGTNPGSERTGLVVHSGRAFDIAVEILEGVEEVDHDEERAEAVEEALEILKEVSDDGE